MHRPSPFKTLASRIAYRNPWMQVREDTIIRPDNTEGIYGVIESKDSVVLIVANERQEICLVSIYRYPAAAWTLELPGGGGEGEDIIEASRRELLEETGITAAHWVILGKTRVCNGLMTERQYNVLATELSYGAATDTEEGIASRDFYSLEKVDEMIASGQIDDGQSITGLYFYKQWLTAKRSEAVDKLL